MIRSLFSSTSNRLPLESVLELANEQLDSARNASTPEKALILCDNAKASIKDAENILNKRVKGQTLNDDIANAYQRHGKLLEELGQHSKAQKSYSKAKKWGYVHIATLQIGSTTRPTNPNDFIHRSLCPPTSLLAASSITPCVYLGVSDINNPISIHQDHADNASLSKIKDQMHITSENRTQTQQTIFQRDVAPSAVKFVLPELGGRISNTTQLAYCLSLLRHSLDSNESLDNAESDWSQAVDNYPGEKERLRTMATDVIRAFVRDELKKPETVVETVGLAVVLDQDDFRKLLEVFVDGIEQSVLLKIHLLDGLSYLMKNALQGSLDPDDLVRILDLLSTRLKNTHQQSIQHTYLLALTVSRVLDSMVDSQVEGLSREHLHEPLSQYLQDLQKSSDPRLVYQAAYAYQSLQHVPNDETFLKSTIRRTGKVIQGISGVVSAVKAIDLDRFIDGLQHIQEGLSGVKDTIYIVNDAYKDVKDLVESGQGFLESLKEGLSFSRKSAWYPALRGLDSLIQEGRFIEFEKLIRNAPCRQDPAFQWGVCQRLSEIASNSIWDTETRQSAISFLGKMYMDDSQWGHQIHVKQWILHILNTLANFPEGDIASSAKVQVQELEAVGDSEKDSPHRSNIGDIKELHTLTLALPLLQQSRLLDIVQNKADVETPLRQLKHERLKGGDGDVYISPKAKHHINTTDSFDLTSKIQEFLGSQKKVFLILGDSGSGKSTFNKALEMNLWNKYGKGDERIPLLIHLPTIKDPEHGLIDKHLRDLNFTESQIRELKFHREFILICDGYDESQQTRNLYTSNRLNQSGQWRAQMVISCRTEYIGVDYKSCFQPTDRNNGGSLELFQEAVIALFERDQIHDYIDQYVTLKKPLWKSTDYQQALRQIPNLQDLVANPFLLKLALEVLPRLLDLSIEFPSAHITRVELYDEFISQWIERGQIRLRDMDLNSRDQDAFKMLSNTGFKQECIAYLKELSTAVYDNQGGNPFITYSERRDQRTWKGTLFNNLDGRNLIRESIPLLHNGEQNRFIHKSVLEYGLSLAVFDPNSYRDNGEVTTCLSRRGSTSSALSFEDFSLIEKSVIIVDRHLLDSPFGRMNFVDNPSISRFLVERVQQQPRFADQLHAVIEQSKTEKTARTAAANAITVLVRAGVQFVGTDLRGIKTPGADLSYGMFDSAQLDGADLRKANLYNIWLRKATLCGAQMAGAKFGELPLLQESHSVLCCAYSQDGQMFATGMGDGGISLYSSSIWEKIRTLEGHVKRVTCLAFSDTCEQIASGSEDGKVRVWDIETGNCVQTLECLGEVLAIITHSPGGYRIASLTQDTMVKLWDVETGNCFQTLQGHDDLVTCATFSPSGDQIVTGARDETVRLWKVDTGDCVGVLVGHCNTVISIAYSPDGSQIASGSFDNTIRLWNIASGHCINIIYGHDSCVNSLMYSPDGGQIASGSLDQTIRLWDVGTGDCVRTLQGHGGAIFGVVYSPSGNQVASGSLDSTVRLWKAEAGNFSRNLKGHTGSIYSIAKSSKGYQIASGSLDSTVRLWDVESGKCLHTLKGHTFSVVTIDYSPKGDQVASGSLDGTVRVWSVETNNCVHILEGHERAINVIKYSPNGDQIASGSDDNTVRLWDAKSGSCVYVLQGHDGTIKSVVFSPKGDQVASGSEDKTVRLWNVETGNCVQVVQGHRGTGDTVVYSPNEGQIAFGSENDTILLWDIESRKCIHILEGHGKNVAYIAYSPKGGQIASGDLDGKVKLWNASTGDCVRTLHGHANEIECITYSQNADKLASGSADNTVRLWDVESGQFLIAITGFSGDVSGVVWQDTSEGWYVVTGSWDKSVRRWEITKEGDEYQVRLCWSSSNDGLVVAEANFKGVQGLGQENLGLIRQRGASIGSSVFLE